MGRVITFPLAVKAFNLGDIFFFYRNYVGTYSKKIMAKTLFLSFAILKISLIILIFFIDLASVDELFFTKYVNKGRVSRHVFFKVFIFFFCWSIPLEIFNIDLSDVWKWLQQCFCFYINSFFNYFIPRV